MAGVSMASRGADRYTQEFCGPSGISIHLRALSGSAAAETLLFHQWCSIRAGDIGFYGPALFNYLILKKVPNANAGMTRFWHGTCSLCKTNR